MLFGMDTLGQSNARGWGWEGARTASAMELRNSSRSEIITQGYGLTYIFWTKRAEHYSLAEPRSLAVAKRASAADSNHLATRNQR